MRKLQAREDVPKMVQFQTRPNETRTAKKTAENAKISLYNPK